MILGIILTLPEVNIHKLKHLEGEGAVVYHVTL